MATKHLGCSNPRNFKEKIELLKIKEAASTANFAAAMRDAREICQTNRELLVGDNNAVKELCTIPEENKTPVRIPAASPFPQLQFSSHSSSDLNRLLNDTSGRKPLSQTHSSTHNTIWSNDQCPRLNECSSDRYVTSNPNMSTCSEITTSGSMNHSSTCIATLSSGSRDQSRSNYYAPGWNSTSTTIAQSNLLSYTGAESFQSMPTPDPKTVYYSGPSGQKSNLTMSHHFTGNRCTSSSSNLTLPQTLPPNSHTPGAFPSSNNFCPFQDSVEPMTYPNPLMERLNTAVDWRRTASDSSIRQSLLGPNHVRTNGNNTLGSQVYHPIDRCESQPIEDKSGRAVLTEGKIVSRSCADAYPISNDSSKSDVYVIPAKRPHTCSSILPTSQSNSCSSQPPAWMDLPVINTSRIDLKHETNEDNILRHKSLKIRSNLISCTLPEQSLSLSYSNDDSNPELPSPTPGYETRSRLSDIPPAELDSKIIPSTTIQYGRSPVREVTDTPPACNPSDLDQYLQLPSLLCKAEDQGSFVGRRDSCTMTAEVLSSLAKVHSECNNFDERLRGSDSLGLSPQSMLPINSDVLANTTADPSDADIEFSSNSFQPLTTISSQTLLSNYPSCIQTVGNRLGISITPNDYQLLTNPQLANYVTDELTEAQLID